MKPKRFILVALAVVIAGFGIWWFTMPSAAIPVNTAAAPMPAKAEAPKSIAPPTIAAPIAPPAPNPVASLPLSTSTPDTSGDPQADLKTAIPDIARLERAGEEVEVYETYTPPDQIDPQKIQQIQKVQQLEQAGQDSFDLSLDKAYADAYETFEDVIPTHNAAGDEVTYPFTIHAPRGLGDYQTTVTFVKINGKWYIK